MNTKFSNDEKRIIKEFCGLCYWTHEVWLTHRGLFDDNPNLEKLDKSKNLHLLKRLNKALQEYVLLQIIKLHDPSEQKGSKNISIEYIVTRIDWDTETQNILNNLKLSLDRLMKEPLGDARRKILCHNDLDVMLNRETLGEFKKDIDLEYFDKLQELVNIVYGKIFNKSYPFDDLCKNNAEVFVSSLIN